jgi:hypothetical protein
MSDRRVSVRLSPRARIGVRHYLGLSRRRTVVELLFLRLTFRAH